MSPAEDPRGRDALVRESNTDLPLQFPGIGVALRIAARALTVRCPQCGGRPVLVHWWRMRPACGQCGLDLQRGEADYFIGSMMFNLVLGEGVFVLALLGAMAWRWPDVPWDALQVAVPLGLVLTPAILFPVSKLAWLGFDLALRPEPPTT
ncbi:MAG: DUF983 domain-containing protein [Gemmatimonadetes bacterium]|nr:DUF983 domain-containing protein [Gemmatimonadota bacterium]